MKVFINIIQHINGLQTSKRLAM